MIIESQTLEILQTQRISRIENHIVMDDSSELASIHKVGSGMPGFLSGI